MFCWKVCSNWIDFDRNDCRILLEWNLTENSIFNFKAKDILENIDLNRNLTSQRTNGFISAITKIRSQIYNGNR